MFLKRPQMCLRACRHEWPLDKKKQRCPRLPTPSKAKSRLGITQHVCSRVHRTIRQRYKISFQEFSTNFVKRAALWRLWQAAKRRTWLSFAVPYFFQKTADQGCSAPLAWGKYVYRPRGASHIYMYTSRLWSVKISTTARNWNHVYRRRLHVSSLF
jgi:hypothetical protein